MSKLRNLTILQINDTHAYLDKHWELFRDGPGIRHELAGGFARIKSFFDQVRNECGSEDVLAFDNGDTLNGTYPAVSTKGEAITGPLNLLKLDAWTVHWDFVFGTKRMQELARKVDHPLLACNCHRDETDELMFSPSAVFERGGVKVGVIGIAAFIIDEAFPPAVSKGVYFTLGREELTRHIKRLREEENAELIAIRIVAGGFTRLSDCLVGSILLQKEYTPPFVRRCWTICIARRASRLP